MTDTSGNVFKQLRGLIADIYDNTTGKVREAPAGRYKLLLEDKGRYEVALKFLQLVSDTEFFKLETQIYLLGKNSTCEQVRDELEAKHDIKMTKNALYQVWYNDKNKFIRLLGADFFVDLVLYKDKDISHYMEVIERELGNSDFSEFHKRSILNLKSDRFVYEVKDEDFEKFISEIRPYAKVNVSKVQKSLDEDVLAYLNYITTHNSLTAKDTARLKRLMKVLIRG